MFSTILLVFAFVLFILAGLNVTHPRVNLIGFGLAFYVASILFRGVRI